MRTAGVVVVLSLAAVAVARPSVVSEPCTCELPSLGAALAEAAVVFEGRVVGMAPTFGRKNRQAGIEVRLEVLHVWKGDVPRVVTVATDVPALCGYPFTPQAEFLVFARHSAEEGVDFETSACSRTRRTRDAARDIAELRVRSAQPTSAPPPPPSFASLTPPPPSPSEHAPATAEAPCPPPTPSPLLPDAQQLGALLALARAQPLEGMVIVVRDPDGTERVVRVTSLPLAGDRPGIVAVFEEIGTP